MNRNIIYVMHVCIKSMRMVRLADVTSTLCAFDISEIAPKAIERRGGGT